VSSLEPPFALCGPAGTLIADGIAKRYCDVPAAQAALSSGSAPIVLGALPFDVDRPAALLVPDAVLRTEGPPDWPTDPLPAVRVADAVPPVADYRTRISRARDRLTAPDTALRKVVLARALRLTAEGALDARMVLRRLVAADPGAYGYLVDLSAAGDEYAGAALVGASPELLVARFGDRVICQPYAGSAPRAADPELDAANGAALAASAKDRHEHQLVIDAMRVALEPLCDELTIAAEPQLSHTAAVPTGAAAELIAELEGDRGFYAGAVGWCDANGDGRWVVSIRCAQLSADRHSALAHAGGGIVAESDPDDEVAETTTKFATILNALGVQQ
jgi:isochorismate synthase